MNKEEKIALVNELSSNLNKVNYMYLTDTSGLKSDEESKLRRLCNKNGVKLKVVKNILLKKAMEKSEKDFSGITDALTGPTAMLIANNINAGAKLIKEFRKEHDKPVLKAAFIDNSCYLGEQHLELLAGMKTKEELIAEIIALLQSPIKNVIGSLQSGKHKLAGIVKTLSERDESQTNVSSKSENK